MKLSRANVSPTLISFAITQRHLNIWRHFYDVGRIIGVNYISHLKYLNLNQWILSSERRKSRIFPRFGFRLEWSDFIAFSRCNYTPCFLIGNSRSFQERRNDSFRFEDLGIELNYIQEKWGSILSRSKPIHFKLKILFL